MTNDESWLTSWPEEPGHYWFHGWEYGDDGKTAPRTFLVEVPRFGKKPIYITEGDFIYKHQACGVWRPRPVELPIPPQKPKGKV